MALGDFVPRFPEEEDDDDVDFEDQIELIPPKEASSHNPIAPSDEKLLPSTQPSGPEFQRADIVESNVTSISNSGKNNAVLPYVMMEGISLTEPSTKTIIPDDNRGDAIRSHEDADEGLSYRKKESDAPDNSKDVWESTAACYGILPPVRVMQNLWLRTSCWKCYWITS